MRRDKLGRTIEVGDVLLSGQRCGDSASLSVHRVVSIEGGRIVTSVLKRNWSTGYFWGAPAGCRLRRWDNVVSLPAERAPEGLPPRPHIGGGA